MVQPELRIPDDETVKLAHASATELSQLLDQSPDYDRVHVNIDGQDLILPLQALVLLQNLLAELASGNAVTIVPLYAELTTQQAADFLNVSRPYLIGLLEKGELNFTKVGTHRRILFKDLKTYKKLMKERSYAAMDKLAKITQEAKLGY